MKDENKKKISILDVVFMALFTLVALAGFIAVMFVGGFIGITAVIYLVKSFALEGAAMMAGGFFMSLLMLGVSAVMGYADYLIADNTIKGVEKFVLEGKDEN